MSYMLDKLSLQLASTLLSNRINQLYSENEEADMVEVHNKLTHELLELSQNLKIQLYLNDKDLELMEQEEQNHLVRLVDEATRPF